MSVDPYRALSSAAWTCLLSGEMLGTERADRLFNQRLELAVRQIVVVLADCLYRDVQHPPAHGFFDEIN